MMAPGGVSGLCYREGTARHLPTTSHPIRCRKIVEIRWTQTKHRVTVEDDDPVPPPGLVTASTLANEGKTATIVSDGSLY